jgi:nucleotide-binding universal stress UspA family protein
VIGTIMVAVDDSSAAFRAAAVAVDLARALGARVVAVSVVDGVLVEAPVPATQRLAEDVAGDAQLVAAAAAQRHVGVLAARSGVVLEGRTVRGRVAEELLAQARDVGADLVVVGRVDRPGVRLAHVGRTAEQVLEFCDVPVLVVPAARPSGTGPTVLR